MKAESSESILYLREENLYDNETDDLDNEDIIFRRRSIDIDSSNRKSELEKYLEEPLVIKKVSLIIYI